MKPRNAKHLLHLLSVLLLAACFPSVPLTSEGRFEEAVAKIASASSDDQRFYALNTAAKEAFVLGKYAEAEQYATELESLTPQFRGNWNYGNAVQDFNLVFGRLAVKTVFESPYHFRDQPLSVEPLLADLDRFSR